MEYVVVFVAGVLAGALPLVIWYHSYVTHLRQERRQVSERADSLKSYSEDLSRQAESVETRKRELDQAADAFASRKVNYDDLLRENSGLKQDLFNLSVQLKKTERDHAALARRQEEISQRTDELAERYLSENVSWIGDKINPTNFASSKTRLLKVIEWCRGVGFDIPASKEEELVQGVRKEYEEAVRAQFAREEQARIRAQVREEERRDRERDKLEKQKQDAERAGAAIQAAVEKALKEGKDEQSAEVQYLRAQLKEAQNKIEESKRAISQAQITKSGHVYVISNIGTFALGEGVFKVGMSRRKEPDERVDELSGASVPFPYEVQMMIECNDAPRLENALHRALDLGRINKVNFRKEFFRTDLEMIRRIVEAQPAEMNCVVTKFATEPIADQYRESMNMSPEDYAVVQSTVQSAIAEHGDLVEED
jgi:hypothetical protein